MVPRSCGNPGDFGHLGIYEYINGPNLELQGFRSRIPWGLPMLVPNLSLRSHPLLPIHRHEQPSNRDAENGSRCNPEPTKTSPWPMVFGAIAFTVLIVSSLTWSSWRSAGFTEDATARAAKFENLAGQIEYLDEVLTSSARLAASTGDLAWEARYKHHVPFLDEAIAQAIAIAGDEDANYGVAQTENANQKLIEIEARALELTRQGAKDRALSLLVSDNYIVQKELYSQGQEIFLDRLRTELETATSEESRLIYGALIAQTAILVLAFLGSLFLVQRLYLQQKQVGLVNNQLLRAKKETEEASRIYTDLYQNAAIGICRTSVDGRAVFANDAFIAMMGYESEADWLAAGVDMETEWYVDGDRRDAFLREVEQSDEVTNFVSRIRRQATGEIIWVSETFRVIRDDDGTIQFFEGTIEDITARIAAEEKLSLASETAARANRLKSEFLANFSHEIRTPLNGVLGMAQLLDSTSLDETQRKYTKMIRLCGEALLSLINDVLDISKIDAGLIEVEQTPFDLVDLLKSVEDAVAGTALQKGIFIHHKRQSDMPTEFVGDEKRIKQILINLAGNAAKFTEQGSITFAIDQLENGKVRFSVADTGPGIAIDQQQTIFERFTQADGSITRKHNGNGLGLAISRDIARLMSGEIGINSTPGEGSTFWFCVPLTAVEPATVGVVYDGRTKQTSLTSN